MSLPMAGWHRMNLKSHSHPKHSMIFLGHSLSHPSATGSAWPLFNNLKWCSVLSPALVHLWWPTFRQTYTCQNMGCEFLEYPLHKTALNLGALFSALPCYVMLGWAKNTSSPSSFCYRKALREHTGFTMTQNHCHLCHSWPRKAALCSRVEAWLSQQSPGWIFSSARAPGAGDAGTWNIHGVTRLLEKPQGCTVRPWSAIPGLCLPGHCSCLGNSLWSWSQPLFWGVLRELRDAAPGACTPSI